MPMSTPTMPGDHRTTDTAVTTKGGMKDERRRGDYSRFTDQDRRALVAHVTAAHAHHSPCRILRSFVPARLQQFAALLSAPHG